MQFNAFLDDGLVNDQAMHESIALDLAALDVEALGLGGLLQGRDPAVSVNRHLAPLSACQLVAEASSYVANKARDFDASDGA